MSRALNALAAALATLAALLASGTGLGASAAAEPGAATLLDTVAAPRLTGLKLGTSETAWQPENRFDVYWNFDLPPNTSKNAIQVVRSQILDASRKVFHTPTPLLGPAEGIPNLKVTSVQRSERPSPGEYVLQVWATGTSDGPTEEIVLRFDDRRPATATPHLPSGWIRGDVEPVLEITPPAGPQPVSGIRGYAISIRPGGAAPPCAGPDLCSLAETDLRGGLAGDSLGLGLLAEGVHVVSVVAVSNSGLRSPQAHSTEVWIDATRPDIALQADGAGWSREPVRVLAKATDALSGMVASGPAGPTTSIAVDGGPRAVAKGDEVAAMVTGSGVHTVAASARDAAGNVRGEDLASPPQTTVVRIDEKLPAVAFSASEDPAEPELVEATVRDTLSGPDLGRGSIAVRPLGSGRPFEPLATTASQGRLTARWDSDSYPDGRYEFRVTGFDLAGNAASSTLRANGVDMVLSNPVKVPTAIRFGFGGKTLVWQRCVRSGEGRRCHREVVEGFAKRPAARVVPYGQGLQVGGRLVSAAGAPLAGHPVELIETFDAGATTAPRRAKVETDADGYFTARLEPGPSRHVEAHFSGNHILTRGASRGLRLAVQTSVRLRASSASAAIGGDPVVFSGRVGHLGTAIPSYGRPVQFQFRLPGTSWTEFRTVQTDASGRFHFPYAFSDDDSRGVRFLFRAYAPPQPGWPYEPAVSRPVAVTGR
ncbi:MAG TPA: hypothetical protein VHR18_08280 [Solirubrobacterales bacterium]|nr:hypothetical protein [Solirubrobacterales bacterium]